jgi:NAD(P)-dependent dehydrogenase (short-subunit alcohol dehydrogenase family)
MELMFKDKVALVTGAASGIGLATARAFAEAGASVALADVSLSAAQAAADELTRSGHTAIAICCDVANEGSVAAMMSQVIASWGRLDVAYNNAGIQIKIQELADVSNEEYERVMSINLRGVWKLHSEISKYRRGIHENCSVSCSRCGSRASSQRMRG